MHFGSIKLPKWKTYGNNYRFVNAALSLSDAEGGTRTPTSYLTRPSNVRVYQFRHFG